MKRVFMAVFVMVVCLMEPYLAYADDMVLKMSTTTSTQSSGLLDILLPEFDKDSDIQVKVIAKGTGAAIHHCLHYP